MLKQLSPEGLLGGARNPLAIDPLCPMAEEEREQRREIVRLLVENGADIDSGDIYGTTPLMLAAICDPDEDLYEEIGTYFCSCAYRVYTG